MEITFYQAIQCLQAFSHKVYFEEKLGRNIDSIYKNQEKRINVLIEYFAGFGIMLPDQISAEYKALFKNELSNYLATFGNIARKAWLQCFLTKYLKPNKQPFNLFFNNGRRTCFVTLKKVRRAFERYVCKT